MVYAVLQSSQTNRNTVVMASQMTIDANKDIEEPKDADVGKSDSSKADLPADSKTNAQKSTGKDKDKDGGKALPVKKNAVTFKVAVSKTAKLPYMVIGAVELCTFFPNHSQWPDYIFRLLRNGWNCREIGRAQLFARHDLDRDTSQTRYNALRYQVRTAAQHRYPDNANFSTDDWRENHPDGQPFGPPTVGSTHESLYTVTAAWGPANGAIAGPPTLSEVLEGVTAMPTGNDRGVFTMALEWAQNQGQAYLDSHTVDDIPGIVTAQNFVGPPEARNTTTWDAQALNRLNATVPDPR